MTALNQRVKRLNQKKPMKNRTPQNRLFATVAACILMLPVSATLADTYTWADNAQGQPYEVCPTGLGPETNYYPNNNLWTQSVETNANCNNTATIISQPSNWDPAPSIGIYPGGPGLTGVDVVIGAPASTKLNAVVTLNSLTVETSGVLGIGSSSSVTANYYDFQGDGSLLDVGTSGGTPSMNVAAGGSMVKSGGVGTYSLGVPLYGTNNTIEVDYGTLALPTGFGTVKLDGGTLAVSNNATLLLTVDSGASPFLSGNFTGVGGGTVLFNTGALESSGGCSLDLPGNMFQWQGGSLKGGPFTNYGVINITNVGPQFYGGATLYNYNLVYLAPNSGLDIYSGGGAGPGIYNETGAIFNIQGDDSLTSGDGAIYNSGLFIKSAGTGLSVITPIFNDQNGTIEVDSGTMDINVKNAGSYSNTTFVVSNGATISFITNNFNMEIDGTLAGSGGGTIFMNDGTVSSVYPTTFSFPGSMFQWAGGKLGDTYSNTEVNLGTINVSGPVGIAGHFANSGTMIQTGAGGVVSGNFLYNYTNALYDIQDDGGISVANLYNYGLVRKCAGTNTSAITGTFYNYGPNASLEVDSGTLELTGIGENYLTNTTLVVGDAGTLNLSAVPSVNPATEIEGFFGGTGGGTVLMTNGTLSCNLGTTMNFPGAMFQWAGGRIGDTATSGPLLTNIGTINVSGPVSVNGYLVNGGGVFQSGAGVLGSGYQFINNPGATYVIQDDNGISVNNFYNYGLLQKASGTGMSVISGNFFNHGMSGAVEVDSGTMAFIGAPFFTNTSFVVSNAATLGLSVTNNSTEIEGAANGSGGGTVLLSSGAVFSSYPATLNFPGAMFQWEGGKLGSTSGSLMTNLGVINVGGPVGIYGTLANSGTIIQSGAGSIGGNSDLDNNAAGIFQVQNDNGISLNTVNNNGLFEKTSGSGTSVIGGAFNNSGPIQALSGALLFTNGTFTQNAGTLQVSSSVSLQAGVQENGGTITGVGVMGNPGPVAMAVSGGVVAPGNPFGALSWTGHYGYSMTSAGAFSFVLGGSNQFGQFQVPNSSATVAGTLNVALTNGYAPVIGTQFQIISSSGRGGTFSTLNVPYGMSVTYSNTGVFLVVTSTLPVDISQPQIVGTNLTFGFGTISNQSYTVQQNTDLTTTNWTFYTNFIGNGSFFQLITPVTNIPELFFRVRQP
jgi:hypothetical protein